MRRYPRDKYWRCIECNGLGVVLDPSPIGYKDEDEYGVFPHPTMECPNCQGRGYFLKEDYED